jgi:hypothetical protein
VQSWPAKTRCVECFECETKTDENVLYKIKESRLTRYTIGWKKEAAIREDFGNLASGNGGDHLAPN